MQCRPRTGQYLVEAIPTLARLLCVPHEEIGQHACFGLLALATDECNSIPALISAGIGPRLVEFLASETIGKHALRLIGHLLKGDAAAAQVVLHQSADLLPRLSQHLAHPDQLHQRLACRALSNLACHGPDLIAPMLSLEFRASLFPPLFALLQPHVFSTVRSEATYVLSDLLAYGSDEQLRCLVGEGVIEPLCALLMTSVVKESPLDHAMTALENILLTGPHVGDPLGRKAYVHLIEQCDGREHLEALQAYPEDKVARQATSLLEQFFAADQDAGHMTDSDARRFEFRLGGQAWVLHD